MKIDNHFKSIHVFFNKAAYQRTRKLKCLYAKFIEKVDEKDILLCDAQSLFYDFLEALRNVTLPQWREALLNKNYILIDGFHYFEKKNSILEELTYIFKHTDAAIFLTLNKPLAQCDFGEKMQYVLSTGTQNEIGDESCALSAAEAAWLIKQDKSLTLAEKHKDIFSTMPDCAFISEDYPDANVDSVHAFLSEYMALENRLLERFYKKESNAVYTYKVWCDEEEGWIGENGELYADFEEAMAEFMDDADLNPTFAQFSKRYIGAEDKRIHIRMRPDGAVVSVAEDRFICDAQEHKLFYDVLFGMDLAFKNKKEDVE